MKTRISHDVVMGAKALRWIVGILVLLASFALHAQEFLSPERAFAMQARQVTPNVVAVAFKIAPQYYMYRERISLEAPQAPWSLTPPDLPEGVVKYDPTFDKDMALYFGAVEFMVELPPWPTGLAPKPVLINITSQGCADAGICYPPMVSAVMLEPTADGYHMLMQQPIVDLDRPLASTTLPGSNSSGTSGSQFSWSDLLTTGSDTSLSQALSGGEIWQVLLLFFGLGLLLAFTPCVLPMIPILSALIIGQSKQVTRMRGLALAGAYVAGMSVVYTLLGVLAGLTGAGLAAWLQTPWVLTLFAVILVVLGLAMFDVIKVEMPANIQTRLSRLASRLPGGNLGAAIVMGAISALIVGPCVAAPLAGALLYISQTGDVMLGGGALFSMAWGMGVPLLIVGMSAGTLLPKSGSWMSGVKVFFGILLIATAWWMVNSIVTPTIEILGWVALAFFSAVLLGAFEPLCRSDDSDSGVGRIGASLRKAFGLLLVVVAIIWLLGVASGGRSLLQPLAHLESTGAVGNQTDVVQFEPIQSIAQLEQVLERSTKPVMLDFYADWCVSCKEMEAYTFSSPEVVRKMQQFQLLKADVTANNADHRALLKRFNLFGPPGIMFFEPGGTYRSDVRVIGFQNAQNFLKSLDRILASQ